MLNARMTAFGSSNFTDFYRWAENNTDQKNKKYFEHRSGGLEFDIPEDTIRHDKNKHGLSLDEWIELSNNANIPAASALAKKSTIGGGGVLTKIKTPSGFYGISFEVFKDRNIVTTAFKSTEKGIDAWMKKNAVRTMQTASTTDPATNNLEAGGLLPEQRLADIIAQARANLGQTSGIAQEAIDWAFSAEPVKNLTGQEFQKSDVSLITQVMDYFKKFNGKVESPEYGVVNLSKKGIRSFIAHKPNKIKAAAFASVPEIIRNGRTIGKEQNYKGRGYDSAVVVAPITIENSEKQAERYIAAVVIKRFPNGTNTYYLHEVIKEKGLRDEIKTPIEAHKSIILQQLQKSMTDLNQGRRGSYSPSKNLITLLKDADRSTFLHESAHYFLEFYLRYLPQELDAVFRFAHVRNRPLNQLSDAEYKQLQEAFAVGFETWLMEGRAPNERLANAFGRFKQWLTEIYESVENLLQQSGLKIELSDDIRNFYADMFARPDGATAIDPGLTYDRDVNLYQDAVKKIRELREKKKRIREKYGAAATPSLEEIERTIRDLETVATNVRRTGWVREAEAAWQESPLAQVQGRKVYIDPDSDTYEEQQVIPAAWRSNDPIKGTTIDELADELGMTQNELLAMIAGTPSKKGFIDRYLQGKRGGLGRNLAEQYREHESEVVGSVTPEIAEMLSTPEQKISAGNIILDNKALTHIEKRHGQEIKDAGFNNARDFVNFVLSNVDAVYEGNKSVRRVLVTKQIRPLGQVVIGLAYDGNNYSVITGSTIRSDFFDKKTSIWERAQTNHSQSKTPETPGAISGQTDALNFTTISDFANTPGGHVDAALSGVERELRGAAARLREQAKRKALSALQQAALREAMKLSPELRLEVMRNVLQARAAADQMAVLSNVYDRAMEEARIAAALVLREQIYKELKFTEPKKGIGKYTHEYNNIFEELRRIQDLAPDEAMAEIERIPDGMEDDIVPDDETFRRAFLEYTANGIEQANLGNLEFVLKGLRELRHEAAGEKKEQNAVRGRAVTERKEKMLAGMRNTKFKGDAEAWTTKLINIYRNGSWFGANMWSVLNSMFGKEMADEWNMEPQEAARDTKAFMDMKEVITEAVNILGLKNEMGFYRWLDEHMGEEYRLVQRQRRLSGANPPVKFNRLGIIDIYNAVKNVRGLDSYNWAYGVENPAERDKDGRRLDVAVQELINRLTPEEKAFGDMLMGKAGEYWDELNEVNIRETGLSMGKVDDYWPSTAVKPGAIVNNNLDFEVVRFGFQKARSRGVVVPIPVDAWGKLNNHLMGTHHALEITLKWRDLRQAIDDNELRSDIEAKYGKAAYKTMLDFVNSMSARGFLHVKISYVQ
ncbi:putative phage protein [Candidatus Termititenax persephonae]|uniref:Phage protein n=1 Tax=Candidatus Termititenax persephonae TaxID=2218525 RepID=A0A388TGU5_9BACT|nr:putative phage protein [Candidatus Termititenax persephonae]